MKIHIIGASGAGKTFLANKLASKYNVPVYSLDDLLWDNSCGAYNVKRSEKERDTMLAQILQNDNWIIEGVQYSWCGQCFEKADIIYLLDTPRLICRFRIIRRFIKRKLSRKSRRNETLKSLFLLLKWTKKFYNVNLVEIKEMLCNFQSKVITIRSRKEEQTLFN